MGNLDHDKIAFEMYEAATRRDRNSRHYLGMSQIGDGCSRKLWLQFRGFTPLPWEGRTLMIFQLGNLIESEVIELLGKCYQIDEQQLEFSAHNNLFRGHCDGVIRGVTNRPHILEIKSASAKKWKQFVDVGVKATNPTYYSQVQCYMGYSQMERALFVIYNKDNSSIHTERIYFNHGEFQSLHNRAHAIISANSPPEPEKSPECKWCNHKFNCSGESVLVEKICGTCKYLWFDDVQPTCTHPQHKVAIQSWGIGCDEWQGNLEPWGEIIWQLPDKAM